MPNQHDGSTPPNSTDTPLTETAKLERDIKTGEICLIIINVLLLITTIVIAKIYYGQLQEMKKATQAAEKAVVTARDTLISSQRPWIGISGNINVEKIEIIPNPMKVNGGESGQPTAMHAIIGFSLENFGNSPARRIAPS